MLCFLLQFQIHGMRYFYEKDVLVSKGIMSSMFKKGATHTVCNVTSYMVGREDKRTNNRTMLPTLKTMQP